MSDTVVPARDGHPDLDEQGRVLLAAEYPRFSTAEHARRRQALTGLAADAGVERVLLRGADRTGSAIAWLTGWPVTREAIVVFEPGERDLLFVQFHNHVPLAGELASDADVRWGGASTVATALAAIEQRPARRTGIIGPWGYREHAAVTRACGDPIDLNAAYTAERQVKSEEEIAWLRLGARFSDAAVVALAAGARPGVEERELAGIVEQAYVPWGLTTHIHYFGITSMHEPRRGVPAQYPSSRPLAAGDVLTTEMSASFWGYPGQVLRTMTIAEPPTPLYRDLHAVAEEAEAAVLDVLRAGATVGDVLAAASVIEAAGFTTIDDLVHGFGGGYLPPVVALREAHANPPADTVFRAGMTVVVQPNVTTPDGRAGVQTGELVVVRPDGVERLHDAPRGLLTVGDGA